jgi:phage terminase small subunit
MPRKSAAAMTITQAAARITRLRPPPSLAEPEANLFRQIIANCAHDHFRQSDLPLLCRYVEASILAERAAQQLRDAPVIDGKPSPWLPVREKAVREMTALSMRLRISPQARKEGRPLTEPKRLSWMDVQAQYGPEVAKAWLDNGCSFEVEDDDGQADDAAG